MTANLSSKKIAFLLDNSGVEQVELTQPWQAFDDAGAEMTLVAPEKGKVQAFNNDVDRADTFESDLAVDDADVANFDALVLPGGTTNADALRMNAYAVALVREFAAAGKPIAAICHGPWALVEADVLGEKTLTSYPSLQTDIRNAGGSWVDQEVAVCSTGGWTLVTSRNPDDLPAFIDAAAEAFASSIPRPALANRTAVKVG